MDVKLTVGLEMLGETKSNGEYDMAVELLTKILNNIVGKPDEEKFRKLRASNPKIGQLLATKGVRAILVGVGFLEQGEFLVFPSEAALEPISSALTRLAAQAVDRQATEDATKSAELLRRQEAAEKENLERKRMKMQIADDAAARKEPGWKAKAAGVKDGKSITGCSDIGIGSNAGG